MTRLTFDHLLAMYRLTQDMMKYEKEASGYRRPSGLAGLMSRPPGNPFPRRAQERTAWYARNLFFLAFRGACPDMVACGAGPEGPEHRTARMDLSVNAQGELEGYVHESVPRYFHDEHFEYRRGYGLRHAYSHSDDRDRDARNRNLAYAKAMEGRFNDDPFFRGYDRKVDALCDRLREAETASFDGRRMQALVSDVEAYGKECEAEARRLNAIRERSTSGIGSLEAYAVAFMHLERLKADLVDGREENTPDIRAEFDGRRQSLSDYRNGALPGELSRRISPVPGYGDRMAYAQWRFEMLTGLNPNVQENAGKFIDSYIGFAARNGVPEKDILEDARRFIARNGVPALRSGLEGRVGRIAGEAVRQNVELFEQRLAAFAPRADMGRDPDLDVICGSLSHDLHVEFERLNGADRAKRFLSAVDDISMGKHDLESVARCYYENRGARRFPLSGVADALVLEKGGGLNEFEYQKTLNSLLSKVDSFRGADFLGRDESLKDILDENSDLSMRNAIREGSWDRKREKLSDPVFILADDMARAAFSIAGDPSLPAAEREGRVGAFLRENGIDIDWKPLGVAFRKAAGKMYGDGDLAGACKVEAFRSRYADRIKADVVRTASAAPARKAARTPGPRI